MFLVWSLDRVAKLYYLILECEKATVSINVTVIHATVPNKTEQKTNRTPIIRLGSAIEQNQTNIIEQNRTNPMQLPLDASN